MIVVYSKSNNNYTSKLIKITAVFSCHNRKNQNRSWDFFLKKSGILYLLFRGEQTIDPSFSSTVQNNKIPHLKNIQWKIYSCEKFFISNPPPVNGRKLKIGDQIDSSLNLFQSLKSNMVFCTLCIVSGCH